MRRAAHRQSGMLLLEVMISLLIAAIALLGAMAMMAKSSRGEMESYQRVQALTLVQDMASRINANRQVASCYSNGANGVATNATLPACASGTAAQKAIVGADLQAWKNALLGATEVSGGNRVGAMIGALGCIDQVDPINQVYRISVAWQGLQDTAAPGSGLACGANAYGRETLRRVVSVEIRIGVL